MIFDETREPLSPPIRVPLGEWTEYGWRQSFGFPTWREKWKAIKAILGGRLRFRAQIYLRSDGETTYLDDATIEQETR